MAESCHGSRPGRNARSRSRPFPEAACGGGGGRATAAAPGAQAADGAGCAARDTSAVAEETADVAIVATVRAREVRVREQARASLTPTGDAVRGVSCDDRRNLPRPARPGTYRDVQVDYRLLVGGTVGRMLENVTAPGGLLTQTVNTLGQTVQRTLDATGGLVERTLDTTGRVVGSRTLGNVTSLPVIRETAGPAGAVVRQARDASGALIEYTLDRAGRVTGARVVQAATGATGTTQQPRP